MLDQPTETRHYYVALDNYPVTRTSDYITAEIFGDHPSIRLTFTDLPVAKARNAIFLLDDGKSVLPYYVVGSKDSAPEHVLIQPMPTNPNEALRPDGRVIDYSAWTLGPRLAYHLKLR